MPRTLVSALAGGLLSLGVARPAAAQSWIEYSEIGSNFAALEASYPDLCARYDLGLSVEGRHLWALRISDNVLVEEDEPEFKYISTMHGNEILGATLCMMLIDHLLNNYGTDGQATNIVDETELWIVPLMNPDGYDRSPRSRYNAHGVDLNRNFPEYGEPNTTSGREIETQHIMNWSFGRSFTCSANLHTGSLVANYPLDNDDPGSQYTPDEDLFIHISEEYSRYNLPMWNSPYFYRLVHDLGWDAGLELSLHGQHRGDVGAERCPQPAGVADPDLLGRQPEVDAGLHRELPDRRARACDRRSPRPAAGRDGHGRRA
jgi:hypothetical protein